MEAFPGNCALSARRATVLDVDERDQKRDEAVRDHLAALDDEIARLRRMEDALDRRIEAAEEERQAIEDATRPRDEE